MNPLPCHKSMDTPTRLKLRAKKHIIEKHIHQTNVVNTSLYSPGVSVRMVYETFTAKHRAGILRRELAYQNRLIYYCPFDHVIGTFPKLVHSRRIVEHRETCYVKVVCATSECSSCGRRVPTEIITMFPDEGPN